jgi:hypothetical protein
MADEPTDLTLRLLRRLDERMTAFEGRLDDLVAEVRRLADEAAIQRGANASLRHDVDVLGKRYHALAARVRSLEPNGEGGE